MSVLPFRPIWLLVAIAMSMMVFTACAHRALLDPESAKNELSGAVKRLWTAKIADDWETVYKMTDTSYQKTVSSSEFQKKKHFAISSFDIHQITLKENRQSARVVIVFEGILLGQLRKVSVGERWIYEKGKWRLKLSDPINPFQQMFAPKKQPITEGD